MHAPLANCLGDSGAGAAQRPLWPRRAAPPDLDWRTGTDLDLAEFTATAYLRRPPPKRMRKQPASPRPKKDTA
jgi:hypothetical protein